MGSGERYGMKKFDWIVVGLIVLIVLSSQIYMALSPADSLINYFSVDDAYYYFKTAQNITLGYGVTFDRINPANGFHPLWMLICVAVFAIFNHDLITPLRTIAIVMGILNAGTSILLYFLLRKVMSEWVAGLGALFWALDPVIHFTTSTIGLETGLSILSIVLFLFLVVRYREKVDSGSSKWAKLFGLGLSAALVIFSRLDNIFIVGIVGLWFLLRDLKISTFFSIDFFVSILSVVISFVIRIGFNANYREFVQAFFTMLWVAAIVRSVVFPLMIGSNRLKRSSWQSVFLRSGFAGFFSTVIVGTILLILSYTRIINSFPRSTLIYDAILSFIMLTGYRVIWKVVKKKSDAEQTIDLIQWVKSYWRRFLAEGLAILGPVVILILGYMLWNVIFFRTPMPISGQIKHWWGTLPNTVYASENFLTNLLGLAPTSSDPLSLLTIPLNNFGDSLRHFFRISGDSSANIVLLILTGLTAVVFWFISRLNKNRFLEALQKTALVPLAMGCFIQFSYYKGSIYAGARYWYWIADSLVILILFMILIDLTYYWLSKRKLPSWILNALIGILGVALISFYVSKVGFTASYKPDPERHDWYLKDAVGLENATEPGSIIGMTGGGTIGYFIKDRTIINLDGLMNSYPYFEAMQKGDISSILTSEKLGYVFSSETVINFSDPYQVLFKNSLQKIKIIWGEEDFILFRYLPTQKQ
jgi:hypothetical protein